MKKSRKRTFLVAFVAIVAGAVWGISTLTGASTTIDPAQLAVVERGTMRRSVVATGRV